ncbi:MAG: hypothetical protein PWP76_67 [Candidatus Diapherotrites archaeon]|nr:hypothetical protein [Candidatus Diapherotrites archaeon]MDN5366954.1 hypothetical protein [Candidatus Diapherotrites archaeon]
MELRDAILERRSVRSFRSDPVSEDLIDELLSYARWAPSAGNLQDWFVYVVRSEGIKRALANAAYGQDFVAEAPVVLVIAADLERAAHYGERGVTLYSIQDTAAFTYAFMLLAHEKGLGTVWVGAFDENAVRTLLDMPSHHRPVAIIPVGYPAHPPTNPGREKVRKKII